MNTGRDPNMQPSRDYLRASFHLFLQSLPEREYFFCVTIDETSSISEYQAPSCPLEQLLTKCLLQQVDLATDGRSGELQYFPGC